MCSQIPLHRRLASLVSLFCNPFKTDNRIRDPFLKKIVKETIEDHYDHACILKWDDPLVQPIMDNCRKVIVVNDNPTAEYMAETFFNELSDRFDRDDLDVPVSVISVSVQETEHNIATYTKGFVM